MLLVFFANRALLQTRTRADNGEGAFLLRDDLLTEDIFEEYGFMANSPKCVSRVRSETIRSYSESFSRE